MTDIDLQSEISFNYHDDDLHVSFGLVGQVSEMWCQRYQALARSKDVNAMVRAKPGGRTRLYLTVPTKTGGSGVQTMLDVARDLIAEADAVDQSPTSSDSAEAVVREWWNRQRAEESLPGESAGAITPAEREARWSLSVQFAIEAASEAEARVTLGQMLAQLDRELPLRGEPRITPLRIRDGIWVATLKPDLTGLASVEPDDAKNRCRYISSHFGANMTWVSRHTEDAERWDWPPDIWSRTPGDGVLLDPAVQAVMIMCEAH